ncbi:MAG: pyridoxamine 5'-phosphate oxidase family protein [Lachnospiraceae bacterium]|nr:pyridoxamine 5'-phosphate oxidase family protein [Lachnospiraceae bacterium]
MFREMRRFKQKMEDEECIALLQNGKRGILAVLGEEGYPYTVPLNFVYEDGKLYFHSAKEGHKIDAIRKCDKASFCILSEGVPEPDDWWYHFDSVVVFGRVKPVEDRNLVREKLEALGRKYMPAEDTIKEEIEKYGDRTAVLELVIEHMSGKRVREK